MHQNPYSNVCDESRDCRAINSVGKIWKTSRENPLSRQSGWTTGDIGWG